MHWVDDSCWKAFDRRKGTGMKALDRITVDPAKMNGEPCIRHLRLTVRRVLQALATYPDRNDLRQQYPELDDEDIRQSLVFASTYLEDKVIPLKGA